MRKKLNEEFLDLYASLDKLCAEKLGVPGGGLTEYITKLNNARFAPDRDDVLPKLVRFRTIRNSLVHDITQLRKNTELQKTDIKWMKSFAKTVQKKKDPLSLYLKKARAFARHHRAAKIFGFILSFLVLAGIAVVAYFLFLR